MQSRSQPQPTIARYEPWLDASTFADQDRKLRIGSFQLLIRGQNKVPVEAGSLMRGSSCCCHSCLELGMTICEVILNELVEKGTHLAPWLAGPVWQSCILQPSYVCLKLAGESPTYSEKRARGAAPQLLQVFGQGRSPGHTLLCPGASQDNSDNIIGAQDVDEHLQTLKLCSCSCWGYRDTCRCASSTDMHDVSGQASLPIDLLTHKAWLAGRSHAPYE